MVSEGHMMLAALYHQSHVNVNARVFSAWGRLHSSRGWRLGSLQSALVVRWGALAAPEGGGLGLVQCARVSAGCAFVIPECGGLGPLQCLRVGAMP